MKHLLRVLAALAALAGGAPAIAADQNPPLVPVKAPVAASAPTGWYLDIEGMGSVLKPGGGVNTLAPAGFGASVGGGYDFAGSNGLVAGIYANGGWVNVRGTATCQLVNCTAGNTWEGEAGARVGWTFDTMNGWLGNSTTFQNLNGKLVAPLQPVPVLQQAILYFKGGVVFQGIRASVAGQDDSRVDLGYRAGVGVEMPVFNQVSWRTEIDYTKFNDAICGGCILTTGRPHEWGGKTGLVYKF